MKLTHWAIVFIILILPFSIICRTMIQKKTLILQDQTRINNILDNATYDAASQMLEIAELGYGKNIPITNEVATATLDRFFQSMAVNFNLPSNTEVAKDYLGQYIPVIIIVGYDGLYTYSYDKTNLGYKYVLKPKIPYAYEDGRMIINFTLGNDIDVCVPSISGIPGVLSLAFSGELKPDTTDEEYDSYNGINTEDLPNVTSNASVILKRLGSSYVPDYLLDTNALQDYEYNERGIVTKDASEFNKLRRETIINLIKSVLEEEVNEHKTYAEIIGVTYDFNIPAIAEEQWQNTIDDISVLAFFQGMPIGADSYYNNFSLGGARIVKRHDLYGSTTSEGKVYHKHNCPTLLGANGELDDEDYDLIFINAQDANAQGYWACKDCR